VIDPKRFLKRFRQSFCDTEFTPRLLSTSDVNHETIKKVLLPSTNPWDWVTKRFAKNPFATNSGLQNNTRDLVCSLPDDGSAFS